MQEGTRTAEIGRTTLVQLVRFFLSDRKRNTCKSDVIQNTATQGYYKPLLALH